ncbi:CesT family type III secretion system chaperone [Acidovorax sp. LjRoot194]|uniref:CesT family type III secretion system chaperone n=1 Tax=Acidovorax sp. LjRoot194 TaxID=3342280 RepID=UPI003ECFA6EA
MKSSAPADPASDRLLQAYASQYGLTAPGAASSSAPVDMTVDGIYRIRLRALPQGGVAVSARLRTLPEPGPARDDMLLGVARLACGTMKDHASGCVVDERGRAIWLQQTAAAASSQDIDDAVGGLVNALAFWSKAIATV